MTTRGHSTPLIHLGTCSGRTPLPRLFSFGFLFFVTPTDESSSFQVKVREEVEYVPLTLHPILFAAPHPTPRRHHALSRSFPLRPRLFQGRASVSWVEEMVNAGWLCITPSSCLLTSHYSLSLLSNPPLVVPSSPLLRSNSMLPSSFPCNLSMICLPLSLAFLHSHNSLLFSHSFTLPSPDFHCSLVFPLTLFSLPHFFSRPPQPLSTPLFSSSHSPPSLHNPLPSLFSSTSSSLLPTCLSGLFFTYCTFVINLSTTSPSPLYQTTC